MKQDGYEIVLKATFIEYKNNLFYYKINGDDNSKNLFINQKGKYTKINSLGDLIYSVPWYYGQSCNICINDFNKNLFLNINEHDKAASISKDYWFFLAEKTGDKYWLTKMQK